MTTQIALEYLGSGYDLCGEYANADSVKKRIFDLDKVPERDIRQLSNRSADFFTISGKSLKEYQTNISAKVDISGSYGLFSGSLKSSFDSTDLSISESGFVSVQLCILYDTWKLQTTSTEYMYPEVLEDFKTQDGKWLIDCYGGGVLMGMGVGGRWADNLTVSTLYNNTTTDVKVAMEAAYTGFLDGKGSAEISKAVKSKESIASRRVSAIGGNPALANPGKLEEWQASVEETPAFMDFTPDGVVMIWELFPEYEEKLKSGFDEYVKEHQLHIHQRHVIKAMYTEGYKYGGSICPTAMSLYKPEFSDSTYSYGGVSGYDNKVLVLSEITNRFGAIREPIGWQQIWCSSFSEVIVRIDRYNTCWLPKAPPGFVALGIYCRFGDHKFDIDPPSKDEAKGLVVVHESLVDKCDFKDGEDNVWSESCGDSNITLGRLPTKALWPKSTNFPSAGDLPSKYKIKDEYMPDP